VSSAAILAGGRATRFGGRDKSALTIRGRSMLDRQIAELRQLTEDIVIVRGWRGGAPSPPREALSAPPAPATGGGVNVRTVHDRVPNCGPLGGLDAALAAARDDPLIVVACDMPYLTAGLLAYLLTLAPEADVVVPQSGRGYHPLCAIYSRACRAAVSARLADGRLRMIDLLADLRLRVVTAGELERLGYGGRVLANVNTPADYEELEKAICHEL
jgi:molybdopterin-guanine dinucleotide biosynthesis protein A